MTDRYERDSALVRRVSAVGALVNGLLALGKGVGGILFHSQALLADAVDSASDLITDTVTIIAVRVSRRPVDQSHPYGHGRFESLASLVIGLMMFGAAGWLVYTAVNTLLHGGSSLIGWPAAAVAVGSVIGKETLYRWTRNAARQAHSPALHANAQNYRNDVLSSSAVVVGVLGSVFIPGAEWLDAVASLIVSGFIVVTASGVLVRAVNDLTDREQHPELLDKIESLALSVPEVLDAHRIRTRRYGSLLYVDLDIEVSPDLSVAEGHDITHRVKNLILEQHEFVADALIHLEPEGSRHEGEGPVRGATDPGDVA